MQLTPTIAIHMSAALSALLIGPWALWARQGARPRPRLHRAAGYAWVTMMLAAAITGIFIRDFTLPNLWGYTPIHLLIPLTFTSLFFGMKAMLEKRHEAHRKTMQKLYWLGCVTPFIFTLLPSRLLGSWVFGL